MEQQAADFTATETELMDVINTLSRAITVSEREMAKNPAAFAQMDTSNMANLAKTLSVVIDAASFPAADKKKRMALVQSHRHRAHALAKQFSKDRPACLVALHAAWDQLKADSNTDKINKQFERRVFACLSADGGHFE